MRLVNALLFGESSNKETLQERCARKAANFAIKIQAQEFRRKMHSTLLLEVKVMRHQLQRDEKNANSQLIQGYQCT